MNDDPMTIKKVGDSFYEAPGCRHRISDNLSQTEEASIIATLDCNHGFDNGEVGRFG